MVKLLGYAPDADPTTPGVITGGSFYATERGIIGVRGRTIISSALGEFFFSPPFLASFPVLSFDGGDTRKLFFFGSLVAGLGGRLYMYDGSTVVDVSRTSPVGYTGGNAWMADFCQVGEAVLATNLLNTLQIRTSDFPGTRFRDVTAPPSGNPGILASALNFAFAFASQSEPDRWWCSALGNPDDWTPSVTTQANTGRLRGSGGGAITAALALDDRMIAYKEREIWIGSYVGSPEVWRWERIEAEGPTRHDRVCDIGGAHVYTSDSGAWIFDGVRPKRIGDSRVSNRRLANQRPVYVPARNSVHIGNNVLNLSSNMWGFYDVSSVLIFPGVDGELESMLSNGTLIRGPLSSSAGVDFTTGSFGSATQQSMCKEVRLQIPSAVAGGGVIVTPFGNDRSFQTGLGSPFSAQTDAAGRVKVDIRNTSYFHQFQVTVPSSGSVVQEVTHIGVSLVPAGKR